MVQGSARAMRWAEEVELLQEEMRRVLCFLMWHENWWHKKGAISLPDNNAEGLVAYAGRQAQLRRDLTECFQSTWKEHLPTTIPAASTAYTLANSSTHTDLPDLDIPTSYVPPRYYL